MSARRGRRVIGARAGLVLVLGLALAGCAPRGAPAPGAADEAAHADPAVRLRVTMRALGDLRDTRLPPELDVAAIRAQRVEALVEATRAIAAAAPEIRAAAGAFAADPDARAHFLTLADELAARAGALAEDAPSLSPEALRAEATALRRVCDDCHGRFRIPR